MNETFYPARCRKGIRKLMNLLCTDAETAYAMMLMTATLMDLNTDDPKIVEFILDDCGIEDSEIA